MELFMRKNCKKQEFRIEKVIKRKGDKLCVKWKGYDNSFNSWQAWELRKKYDGNFIFTFAVIKVRYSGITMAKIFKHGNYLK